MVNDKPSLTRYLSTMADRKVLVNYIHPDIDPLALSRRRKKPKTAKDGKKTIEVRTMLPFNLQCDSCKEYMYAGKKFNGKKEVVEGEEYMGTKILRFYIKCSTCSASITFKTDPQNAGYKCEWGASRNFEVWREDKKAAEEEAEEQQAAEEADAMKKLESKTLSNQQEMDEMDALEQIRAQNKDFEKIDTRVIIEKLRNGNQSETNKDEVRGSDFEVAGGGRIDLLPNGLTEEDEALVQRTKFKSRKKRLNQPLSDSDSESLAEGLHPDNADVSNSMESQGPEPVEASEACINVEVPLVLVSRKRKLETAPSKPKEASGALSMLTDYGSDSDT